jgi:EmrB/QacA subfamily drug resistance transporter
VQASVAIALERDLVDHDGRLAAVDADDYRRRLLRTVLLAVVAFSASMTIVSASLTEIADSLGAKESTLAWSVTGIFLAMAVGTPVMGKLGDLHGHRRVFVLGATVLTAGTVACALAWNAAAFIGFRMIVGVGISATMPNGMALIMGAYPVDERPRAMGWFQMAMTSAPVIGLAIGGPMIDAWGWRTVFAVLAPISAAGLVAAWRVVRDDGHRQDVAIDWVGAATLGAGILSFLLALESTKHGNGFDSPRALGLFGLAATLIVAFTVIERRKTAPLLRLDYFRRRDFTGPLVAQSLAQFAYMGGFLITPVFLDDIFGLGVTTTALVLLVRPGVWSVASPFGGRLTSERGGRVMMLAGATLMVASMVAFALSAVVEHLWLLFPGLALSGLAMGLASPAYSTTVAGAVDPADLGVANGMNSTFMNIGTLTGIQTMFVLLGDDPSADRFAGVFAFGACVAALSLFGAALVRGRTAATVATS